MRDTKDLGAVMPEGEKLWGGAVVISGDNLPSPVGIGLTDPPNIGGPVAPPPGSGIIALVSSILPKIECWDK